MECYDGPKICKLVGSHLLNKSFNIVDKESVELYRDDRLGVLWNLLGPQTKRKREAIVKVFKEFGLRITIQAYLLIVNFLDVQLNLGTSTDKPYRKPDNNPVYLDKISNHFKTETITQSLETIAKISRKTYVRYTIEPKCFDTINSYVSSCFLKECFYRKTQFHCKRW